MSVDSLRDIIGCTCSFNETYDGKSYNLKTEQYEDCGCKETLPMLHSLLISKLPEKRKVGYCETEWDYHGEDNNVQGFNRAVDNMRKSIDEMFNKEGNEL